MTLTGRPETPPLPPPSPLPLRWAVILVVGGAIGTVAWLDRGIAAGLIAGLLALNVLHRITD